MGLPPYLMVAHCRHRSSNSFPASNQRVSAVPPPSAADNNDITVRHCAQEGERLWSNPLTVDAAASIVAITHVQTICPFDCVAGGNNLLIPDRTQYRRCNQQFLLEDAALDDASVSAVERTET